MPQHPPAHDETVRMRLDAPDARPSSSEQGPPAPAGGEIDDTRPVSRDWRSGAPAPASGNGAPSAAATPTDAASPAAAPPEMDPAADDRDEPAAPPAAADPVTSPPAAAAPEEPDDGTQRFAAVDETPPAAAAPPRHDHGARAARHRLDQMDLQPAAPRPPGDEAGDLPLARPPRHQVRVGGVDANEVGQQCGQFVHVHP